MLRTAARRNLSALSGRRRVAPGHNSEAPLASQLQTNASVSSWHQTQPAVGRQQPVKLEWQPQNEDRILYRSRAADARDRIQRAAMLLASLSILSYGLASTYLFSGLASIERERTGFYLVVCGATMCTVAVVVGVLLFCRSRIVSRIVSHRGVGGGGGGGGGGGDAAAARLLTVHFPGMSIMGPQDAQKVANIKRVRLAANWQNGRLLVIADADRPMSLPFLLLPKAEGAAFDAEAFWATVARDGSGGGPNQKGKEPWRQ